MTLRGPSVGLDSRVFKIVNLQNWVKIDEKNESPQFRDNSFQFCIIWVIMRIVFNERISLLIKTNIPSA